MLAKYKELFKKYSILICDDNEDIRSQMHKVLSPLFKNTFVAQDGKEALAIYEEFYEEIDIVMTDHYMPFMNGIDLIKKIRENDSNTMFLLVTGDMTTSLFMDAIKCKLDDFILKPIQFKSTFNTIYNLLLEKEKDMIINEQNNELTSLIALLGQHNLVTRTDKKGLITYANDMFLEVSGYSKDEVIGKTHRIVRHPDMPSLVFQDMWNTIQGGHTWKGKIKNMTKCGKPYIVNAMVMPIFNKNAQIEGYVSSRHLVTEEILKLSKMKKGYMELKVESVKDKNEIVTNVKNEYEQKIKKIQEAHCVAMELVNGKLNSEIKKNRMLLQNLDAREKELGTNYDKQSEFNLLLKERTAEKDKEIAILKKEIVRLREESSLVKVNLDNAYKREAMHKQQIAEQEDKIKDLMKIISDYEEKDSINTLNLNNSKKVKKSA